MSLVIDDRTCFQGFKLKGAGELIPDIMVVLNFFFDDIILHIELP